MDHLKGPDTRQSVGYWTCPITLKQFEFLDGIPSEPLCVESRQRALDAQVAHTRDVLHACLRFLRRHYGIIVDVPNL